MDVRIGFIGDASAETSGALEELATVLSYEGMATVRERSCPEQGRKDGGLTLAITLAGLAVSATGTLVSVLSYWRSTRPKYKISLSRGGVTVEVEGLNAAEVAEVTSRLTGVEESDDMLVEIDLE